MLFCIFFFQHRTVAEAKTKLANLKRKLRTANAAYRLEVFKTGGGRPPQELQLSEEELTLSQHLGVSFDGLKAAMDSDWTDSDQQTNSNAFSEVEHTESLQSVDDNNFDDVSDAGVIDVPDAEVDNALNVKVFRVIDSEVDNDSNEIVNNESEEEVDNSGKMPTEDETYERIPVETSHQIPTRKTRV